MCAHACVAKAGRVSGQHICGAVNVGEWCLVGGGAALITGMAAVKAPQARRFRGLIIRNAVTVNNKLTN